MPTYRLKPGSKITYRFIGYMGQPHEFEAADDDEADDIVHDIVLNGELYSWDVNCEEIDEETT